MSALPGLRSPRAKVGRLVYSGRMLDKIRLHAAGRLPAGYAANLGWRDDRSAKLRERVGQFGLAGGSIGTIFDLINFDEVRDPVRDPRVGAGVMAFLPGKQCA